MIEIVSAILVIVAGVTFLFALIGFVAVWFHERNLPPDEKERRRVLWEGEASKEDFKKTKYALLIVAVSYLFALSFILVDSWQDTQQRQSETLQQSQNQEQVVPETNDTSTWQTYRNDEFGFEIEHPAELEVSQTSLGRTIFMRKDEPPFDTVPSFYFQIINFTTAHIDENKQKLPLDEWMAIYAAGPSTPGLARNVPSTPQKIMLGGRDAYRADNFIFVMDDERTVFQLSFSGQGKDDPAVRKQLAILEQMLSTFRFVEPIKANFDYPSEWGELSFKENINGTRVFEAKENSEIDRVFYKPSEEKILYITQKEPWQCFSNEAYKAKTLYLLENGVETQLYKTRHPGDNCYGGTGIWGVWFMENPQYITVSVVGYEWSDSLFLDIEGGKNILDGYEIWWPGVIWSPDKNTLILISSLSEFGGEGGEALFVSDYGNPDILNEVIRIPNEFFLERQIEDVEFQGNDTVTFTLSHEQGVTNYEYDVQLKQLNEIE